MNAGVVVFRIIFVATIMSSSTPAARAFLPLRRAAQNKKLSIPTTLLAKNIPGGSTSLHSTTKEQVSSFSSSVDAPKIVDTSTMTLLEHINLNVPSHEYILPFYYTILGMGMDPRKAANLDHEKTGKTTLWANCGASQFHLPYGKEAQKIPGCIGLQYPNAQSLQELEQRLEANPEAYERYEKREGYIYIVDKYGNQFHCRVSPSRVNPSWQQPFIGSSGSSTRSPTTEEWSDEIVQRFGRDATACVGIQYVEFSCPIGTAEKIALFYDSVFDATTAVVEDPNSTTGNCKVAVIAFGNVTESGQADQSLLFRETTETIPPYDGHHVAMYVGQSGEDFEQAFKNCVLAGVVWVNPRFSDKADTLEKAKELNQFRFKDIVDMDTGKRVFELEHEIRSVKHEAWPGQEPL